MTRPLLGHATFRIERRRTQTAGIGLLLAAVFILQPNPGRAADIKRPDYTGHFVGDHRNQSEINVKVVERHGRPAYALFEADGLLLGCDDGSKRRVNSVALRYRFVNRTTFYGDSVSAGGTRTIYRVVKGKISRDGTSIRGYVTQFEDALPTSTQPDCGSGARAQWRASLVRG